jgi:hypothetical protein
MLSFLFSYPLTRKTIALIATFAFITFAAINTTVDEIAVEI